MANSGKPPRGEGNRDRVNWQGQQRSGGATAQQQWQQDPQRERRQAVARANRPRRIKLAAAGLTALALLGALVYFLMIGSPATPLLAVAFTGYATPLPPNAWAKEDVDRFETFQSPSRSFRHRGAIDPETHNGQDDWFDPERPGDLLKKLSTWLDLVTPGGPRRNTVVIYLSGHGVVNDSGEPCLVLPDKGGPSATPRRAPWDTRRWLHLGELVEKLDEQRPNVKKVIFLDANRIDVQWNMGVLANGFAAALPKALANASTVAVINSASPGEKAWAATEWRASFFGDSVRRALAGAADGELDGRRNKIVSFEELAAFVRDDVRGLVDENRHDRQTPLAINGVGRDFDIARVDVADIADDIADAAGVNPRSSDAPAETAEPSKPAGTRLAKTMSVLAEMWRIHERWRPWTTSSAGAAGEHWFAFQLFEQRLLRWEQELLAGRAYEDAAARSEAIVKNLAEQLESSSPAAPAAHSLALEQLWTPPSDQARAADQAFTRMLNDDRPPSDQTAGNEPADAKPASPEAAHSIAPYAQRAAAGWTWLVEGSQRPTVQRLHRFLSFVGLPQEGRVPLAEDHFVSLLIGDRSTSTNVPLSVWNQNRELDDVRTALRARDLAEKAAAPRDARVQYALRPIVDAADSVRRQADDQLFIGRPEALTDAREKWRQAAEAYQEAIELGDELAGCLAARDRAWSQLPHWGQHVDRRWRYSRDARQMRAVAGAIAATSRLAEAIERYQRARQSAEGNVSDVLDEAKLQRDKLTQTLSALDTSAESLLSRALDAQKVRDMESLLTGPLVSGKLRAHIHQSLVTWLKDRGTTARGRTVGVEARSRNKKEAATALARDNEADDNEARDNEPTSDGASDAPPWEIHPALLLLADIDQRQGARAAAPGRKDELSNAGTDVRKALAALETSLTALPAETPQAGGPSVWKEREALSIADRRVRPAVAFWVWPGPETPSDPVRRLNQFDRSQFLAWHGDRLLSDFWGPSGPGDVPYFAKAFRAYRAAAQDLPAMPALTAEWKQLDDRCQRLQASLAAKLWVSDEQAAPRLVAGGLETAVLLEQAEYPPGTAALLARDGKEQPAAVVQKDADDDVAGQRLPVDISGEAGRWPRSGEPLELVLRAGDASATGQVSPGATSGPWQLIWLYRGHQRPYQVDPPDPGQGMELVYQPVKAREATIRVRGEAKQPGCVVFVLDCSGSMKGGRMAVAKADLNKIIGMLAQIGQYNVGLWFYGHRIGVVNGKLEEGNASRKNRNLWGKPPPSLVPAHDAQSILSTRLLDQNSVDEFQAAVDTAEAYAETPLYYSMIEAIRSDLSRKEPPRRLVVITDGYNRVTDTGAARLSANDVKNALTERQNLGIQIDIVGVQLGVATPADKTSFEELQSIVDNKTVWYHDAQQLNKLLDVLKKALQLRQYTVANLDNRSDDPQASKPENLGKPIIRPIRGPEKLRVSIVGDSKLNADVEVRGDETLELYLDKQAQQVRLVHAPIGTDGNFERYGVERQTNERMAVREAPNPDGKADSPFNPAKLFLAAYRPNRGAGTRMWRFPIAVQNAAPENFSPRPAEAWIDVTPIAGPGEKSFDTYPVYDVVYEPHLPVPVIDCALSRWPEAATKAEIRLWLKFRPTPPRQEVQVRDVVSSRVLVEGGKRGNLSAEILDATAEDDRAVVRVTERLGGAGELRWLKIELSEMPGLVRRTFYHKGRYAIHEFYFPNRVREDLSKLTLLITPRDDLERGAVAVADQPLEVSLP